MIYSGSAKAIGGIIRTSRIQKSIGPLSLYLYLVLASTYEQDKPNISEKKRDINVTCKLFEMAMEKLFCLKSRIKCLSVNDFGKRERDVINSASSLIDRDTIQYIGKTVHTNSTTTNRPLNTFRILSLHIFIPLTKRLHFLSTKRTYFPIL